MPYVSEAQRRKLHATNPELAARWDREYPNQGKLPERVLPRHKRRRRKAKR